MEIEEENEDKKNKNQTGYRYIINIDETFENIFHGSSFRFPIIPFVTFRIREKQ